MTSNSPWLARFAAAALAVVLAGCGDQAHHPIDTTSASAPVHFDPCTALTPEFLAAHRWDALAPDPRHGTDGAMSWKGCRYVARTGYGFVVETTNHTLDQIQQKFPAAVEISINDRRAVRYEALPDIPGGCTINVETRSGSVYVLVDAPQTPMNKANGMLDACAYATEIAEEVVRLLPAGI
ncbi:DUF3558 domain-containing protein [Nocardia brasiliensis]